MSGFGHFGFGVPGVRVDYWGAGPFVITMDGKGWRFEDSDRFGPSLVKKNGEIRDNPYPGERSPFWRAHRIWVRQGRRLGDDGVTCIWDEPLPMRVRRVARGFTLVIDSGEEDGRVIVVPTSPNTASAAANPNLPPALLKGEPE